MEYINDKKVLTQINYFSENQELELIKQAQIQADRVNELWKEIEQDNSKEDLLFSEITAIKSQMNHFFSIYAFVSELDKHIDRNKDNEIFDIREIFISEKLYFRMKNFDSQIFDILYKDRFTEIQKQKELGMIHFISGFTVSEEVKEDIVIVTDKVIIKEDIS